MPEGKLWILERIASKRFPYRIRIVKGDKPLLALKVQSKWPGSGTQVFCLRDESLKAEIVEIVETVPIVSMRRYGRRLAIVLDRKRNKRCDFLFLKRSYKNKEGEYEQIFWRTYQSLKATRKGYILPARNASEITVYVDKEERYPWRFPDCLVERVSLPVGDYALAGKEGFIAIVERKTFDNMLSELGKLDAFHQTLGELEAYPYNALVIEAGYPDFLDRKRLHHYNPSVVARALADISALHPKLKVIFAHSRKGANEWCRRYFESVYYHLLQEKSPPQVRETVGIYTGAEPFPFDPLMILKAHFPHLPETFTVGDLREAFPQISDNFIRSFLKEMKKRGTIICIRRGPLSYWKKVIA